MSKDFGKSLLEARDDVWAALKDLSIDRMMLSVCEWLLGETAPFLE